MQKEQIASFIRLHHVFGIGRVSLISLGENFDDNFNYVTSASRSELQVAGLNRETIDLILKPDQARVDRELEWAEQSGNQIICYDDASYPALLRQTVNFPPLLYCSGNIDLLASPQIAIVGSRHCTPGGAKTATDFARVLAQSGLTITSGMATGIDTHAHLGALACGGNTIAVTGTGLDRIYPSSNRQMAYDIHEKGLLVTEFPLGTSPRSDNFPRRNRIISGLCVATLVVEAARRSGSLITAHQAVEQGREVFAIPGSIHNPQARGCHQLIREGAKLVDQASDIIEELGSLLGFIAQQQINQTSDIQLDQEAIGLLEVIGYDPVSADALVERSGLTIDKLSSMLLSLELSNLIQSAPGGCFVRI
ncbi:MAG: DNA-processing protein DprA [Gammaproteobacteria bacterium]|nr:DNA-processing protein DprA [Gammaproteobacteria bacterium]